MQLKKFEAPTINEALQRIKSELGDDAVIFDLRTRCGQAHNGGREGTWVEVTAAVERHVHDSSEAMHAAFSGTLNSLINQRTKSPGEPSTKAATEPRYGVQDVSHTWAATRYSPWFQNMLLSGFTQAAAGYLIGEAAAAHAAASGEVPFKIVLQKSIGKHLAIAGPLEVRRGKKKKVAFIGPTGVGKTTTLAKVAAQFAYRRDMTVKIITIDTYRIAAAEQLKLYGKIMNLPVMVAATVEDFDRELQRCEDADLVLIDTAGRNCRDAHHMAALGNWLGRHAEIETHLLLSATTTPEVVQATVRCFLQNRVNCIIITKIDESIRCGHLYDILAATGIPISYVTNGQRVPEDIVPASTPLLAELMLEGYGEQSLAAV